MKNYWFKAKRYGYGWTPDSWQGWVILAAYVASLLTTFLAIDHHSHSVSDTLIAFAPVWIILTAILLLICLLTGEKPRWLWGE